MAFELLRTLADGQRHSGEALGEKFGITRAAVWKKVQKLTTLGLEIESLKHHGYKLMRPINFLEADKILQQVSDKNRQELAQLEIFDTINSTNTYLLDMAKAQKSTHAKVVLAELQTAGRGRHGKVWQSPFSSNIYTSIGWSFDTSCAQIGGLSLAVGVVVASVLQKNGIDEIGLKWPNDIYLKDGKLGGILIEIHGDSLGNFQTIIGIGLNFHLPKKSLQELKDRKVSYIEEVAPNLDRNLIAGQILEGLFSMLQTYPQEGFAKWQNEWNALHKFEGKECSVQIGKNTRQAVIGSVNVNGALEVTYQDASKEFLQGGEISFGALS